MLWSEFYDGFWDWSDSTRKSRISSLEDIGSGDEVVDAIYEIEDPKIRTQLIRKAIKLGAKFTTDDFQNLEGELPIEVYEELGRYAGFDADNPTYDKSDTSWSHFYDNFTEWDPDTQTATINDLQQMGKHDEVVDAILILEDKEQRAILTRKAIAFKVKFTHEDFENLQDELPAEVYRELAAYTGHSVDCPDYDKDNHTWKYFYENCGGWTEQIQLGAIASLKTIGSQKQVMEAILELETEAPKIALVELAIKRNVVFSRDSLQELDGSLPDEVFQRILRIADVPEDDLYFDEDNIDWDDFYGSYSDWNDEVLLRRIKKLRSFGPSEEVADAVQCMPNAEAEDLLYKKAVAAGVRFNDDEMLAMGNLVDVLKRAINNLDVPSTPRKTVGAPIQQKVVTPTPGRTYMGLENTVVDIQILNVEDHGSNVLVNYTKVFGNGSKKTCRTHVRDLGGYYRFFSAKPIVTAECLGKVYLGLIKSDVRILFIVKLNDGSAELIQAKEGSEASLKLLQLSEDTANGTVSAPVSPPPAQTRNVEPYQLKKNELPQGSYLVGRDIPAGTYDFFVVYGNGGSFDIAKYDSKGEIINGTWTSFWVGLKEDYEKRELIHISCQEGYTIKIKGSVILKIARSQSVKIDL